MNGDANRRILFRRNGVEGVCQSILNRKFELRLVAPDLVVSALKP